MTSLLTLIAGIFIGGIGAVVAIVVCVAFGRSLGQSIGKKVAPLVRVDASKVDVERMTNGRGRMSPAAAEDVSTPDSDTAVVRAALKQLKFNTHEIDYAVSRIRGRALPVAEKIRAALASLDHAKNGKRIIA